MFFEVGTSAYIRTVVFMEPISRHLFGPVAVWDTAAIGIVTLQVLVAIAAMAATVMIQSNKRDFV